MYQRADKTDFFKNLKEFQIGHLRGWGCSSCLGSLFSRLFKQMSKISKILIFTQYICPLNFLNRRLSIFCYTESTLKLRIILTFIETIVSNCLTTMFSMTFFLNLTQFDAKLARVQTKPKPYPDSTVLPQSIYRRVCEFSFLGCCLRK